MQALAPDNPAQLNHIHQTGLEEAVLRAVHDHRGLKETDLVVMILSDIGKSCAAPLVVTPEWIITTVDDMIRRGDLVGVDYSFGQHRNTFLLPGETKTAVSIPIRIADTQTRH